MKRMSKITDGLVGQPMFNLLARAHDMESAGRRIHHFEIGDSYFRAHQHILDATKQGLDQDRTHYVDSSGISELKEAICDHTAKTLGFCPDADQVLVMPANSVIDSVFRCLVDPGDEVLVPDPGFSTYLAVTNYTGIKRVGYPLLDSNAFQLDVADLAARISPRTRLLVLNSPNNPTGSVVGEEDVRRVAELAERAI